MIDHAIIVTKEKEYNVVPWKHQWEQQRLSQEDLNKFIAECDFNAGEFVTFATARATQLSQISYILRINNDHVLVSYQPRDNIPKILKLMSIYNTNQEWIRADTTNGYRKITQDEYDSLVKPNHDRIQNHIQRWNESNK